MDRLACRRWFAQTLWKAKSILMLDWRIAHRNWQQTYSFNHGSSNWIMGAASMHSKRAESMDWRGGALRRIDRVLRKGHDCPCKSFCVCYDLGEKLRKIVDLRDVSGYL